MSTIKPLQLSHNREDPTIQFNQGMNPYQVAIQVVVSIKN